MWTVEMAILNSGEVHGLVVLRRGASEIEARVKIRKDYEARFTAYGTVERVGENHRT